MKATIGRWIIFSLGLCAVLGIAAFALRDSQAPGDVRDVPAYKAWDPKTLEIAALIPVQDGGRVKPLGTYAGFTMLRLNGARSMEVKGEGGGKVSIKPLDWLMDCLFRPELAADLPTFLVDNSEVLEAAGIPTHSRRDRYSYNDFEVGRDKLMQLAASYEEIQKRDAERGSDTLKTTEKQTLDLAYNIRTFEGLAGYFSFARNGLEMRSFPGKPTGGVTDASTVMATLPMIVSAFREGRAAGEGDNTAHIEDLLRQYVDAANHSKYFLFLFPPGDPKSDQWLSAGQRMGNLLEGTTQEPDQSIKDVKSLETLVKSLKQDEGAFRDQLTAFENGIVERAKARGEYRSVPLEADYFRKNWFIYALVWFLLASVTAGVMFFTGRSVAGRISMWATVGLILTGLAYLIVPIVKRSIIMQRPPVGNLYDTIIFIAMVMVIFALIIEAMTRRRFVLGVTPIVAALLIVIARRFEVGEGKDHLDPLIAVLRSNMWLTIHVLTITVGYAAGLLTALLSVVYVLMRSLGLDGGDAGTRRALTRAVYGCVCLTLLLSLIGTVLGGIWANDSWGRFWGWDPKENGALMIVLWNLAILHARVGGYIREWGLHLASLFGANVVAFSWWHVNFLNVGLHNYGFAADKKWAVLAFYGLMAVFILLGMVASLLDRKAKQVKSSPSLPPGGKPAEALL